MKTTRRTILHVDMDAFFAAIEQRDNPSLRGKPVIVGAPPDRRGVVSTCSYEARAFGVHSAMPSRTAYKLCPQGVFVPVRGERYHEVSEQVMSIFEEFTPMIEQVSVDEAFLDIAGVLHIWHEPVRLARALKARIRERLGLTASVGIAPNKFLAKLASDLEKPDGLTVVPETEPAILAFLAPLPVTKIWGVGKTGAKQLERLGITTIGQLQACDEAELSPALGAAMAQHVWTLARGRDGRRIETETEDKSVSAELTFPEDIRAKARMRQTLLELAEKVGRRLRRRQMLARTGRLKLRFADFRTITRQRAFETPTCSDRELLRMALDLFEREPLPQPVRLLGFGVSNLVTPSESQLEQQLLFDIDPATAERRKDTQLDQAVDKLREKFGRGAIRRGVSGYKTNDI